MKHLQRFFVVAALIAITGCATSIPRDYAGADAGYLIVSLGAAHGTFLYENYRLQFKQKGVPALKQYSGIRLEGGPEGGVYYIQSNIFGATPRDFDDNTENGFVDVQKLPPGEYEIYNYKAGTHGPFGEEWYFARQDFSIPFTITPGKATYIGDFSAVGMTGKSLIGLTVPAGAYFILSDKQSRDIPIAKTKMPELSNVDIQPSVVDAATVGSPLIQSKRTGTSVDASQSNTSEDATQSKPPEKSESNSQ